MTPAANADTCPSDTVAIEGLDDDHEMLLSDASTGETMADRDTDSPVLRV